MTYALADHRLLDALHDWFAACDPVPDRVLAAARAAYAPPRHLPATPCRRAPRRGLSVRTRPASPTR